MPPRRPRPLGPGQLGDEGTTATPAPHNERGAWVFTSLARPPSGIPLARDPGWGRQEVPSRLNRAPPPNSHLRGGQAGGGEEEGV